MGPAEINFAKKRFRKSGRLLSETTQKHILGSKRGKLPFLQPAKYYKMDYFVKKYLCQKCYHFQCNYVLHC